MMSRRWLFVVLAGCLAVSLASSASAADVGYLLAGRPEGGNTSLFVEARLPADELGSPNEFGRFGLGLRFRF
jgi:hypothetical protein